MVSGSLYAIGILLTGDINRVGQYIKTIVAAHLSTRTVYISREYPISQLKDANRSANPSRFLNRHCRNIVTAQLLLRFTLGRLSIHIYNNVAWSRKAHRNTYTFICCDNLLPEPWAQNYCSFVFDHVSYYSSAHRSLPLLSACEIV